MKLNTGAAPGTRRSFPIASLWAILVVAAMSLPLLASTTSAVAAAPRTTPPIGKQLAEMKGPDTVTPDSFGFSAAISGKTAIVGAPFHAKGAGRAYVFAETATGWKQLAELKGSDTVAGDDFGYSVAISGTTAIVGAPFHAKGAGRAYVFTKTAKGWKQVAELKGSDTVAHDSFGFSVAISGTNTVVGAPLHQQYPFVETGRAYVFTKTAKGWKQVAELRGSTPVAPDDEFGYSVAISGANAIVGEDGYANFGGLAYVFTETAKRWKQVAELLGSGETELYKFGYSVAISGTTAVVGAPVEYAGGAGRSYVFTKTAKGWKQVAKLTGSAPVGLGDYFGYSVAISGMTAVVGALGTANTAGRGYIFSKTSTGWKQLAGLKGSDTVAGDEFGSSVAISGATAVVGASFYANHAGRAYLFEA
jgi:hypothetical protein